MYSFILLNNIAVRPKISNNSYNGLTFIYKQYSKLFHATLETDRNSLNTIGFAYTLWTNMILRTSSCIAVV